MSFQYYNDPSNAPKPPSSSPPPSLTLTAEPGTDIWKKPPSHCAFSAPLYYRSVSLSNFRSARVTISALWKTLYDQGGLCLVFPQRDYAGRPTRWIKTGIEVYQGVPNVSTVACDRWADWSLVPLPMEAEGKVTVEMKREVLDDGKLGSMLVVYMLDRDGKNKRPVREITWAFEEFGIEGGEGGNEEEEECWLGVYAAKPTPDSDNAERELMVTFEELTVQTT